MSRSPSRRLAFFGGQGSRSLFSQNVSLQLEKAVAASSTLALLLSSCHAALLTETVTMRSRGPIPEWADLEGVFRTQGALLAVPQRYWTNAIVQGIILCLYQLLIQLQQQDGPLDADSRLQPLAGVIGFCSGMLPAIVLVSSRTVAEYVERSREMIRLAYWIGYRAAQMSMEIAGEGETWATLSVVGLNQSEITEFLVESSRKDLNVHLCTRFGSAAWSLSGPAKILHQFRETYLAGRDCEPVHVHALYHGGDHGIVAMQRVLGDVTRRRISFPALKDLCHSTHLWSAHDGSWLNPESPLPATTAMTSTNSLLEYTLQSILVEKADLYMTWSNLSQWLANSASSILQVKDDEEWEIIPVGPGSRALLLSVSRDVLLPKTKVIEPVSDEETGDRQDGFAIVGMSVNFPLASNKAEFWDMLERGLNAVEDVGIFVS